jgi:cell division protein FtsZ
LGKSNKEMFVMAAQEEFTMTKDNRQKKIVTEREKAVIKIVGVGGGGGNAVNRMIEAGLSGVEFIAINTDPQDLEKSLAPVCFQIGKRSLGAGANPEVGRQACEEDRERVRELLVGGDLVFLTLGLGGGTGTGAAPIVAQEAAEVCKLIIAIVTIPFTFEGRERMNNALKGLEELEKYVDTLIVIPNDRIAELSNATTSLLEAFRLGDEVLRDGVQAISSLLTATGLVNLDFEDLRAVMQGSGRTLMGIGIGEGEDRALHAVQEAVVCPLLEQSSIAGAKAVIVNVHGGKDLLLQEYTQINDYIYNNVSADARIFTGVVTDQENERPELQVTVIATGFPKRDITSYTKPSKENGAAKAEKMVEKAVGTDKGTTQETKVEPPKREMPHKPVSSIISTTNAEDLFSISEKKTGASPFITTSIDEPEDMNIPAFIRARKRRQENR